MKIGLGSLVVQVFLYQDWILSSDDNKFVALNRFTGRDSIRERSRGNGGSDLFAKLGCVSLR